MDEIRLTCPACEVQYRLRQDAIPAGGREVECTACGHVWMAKPQSKPLSLTPGSKIGDDPVEADEEPTAPRLNRPLPPNVLSILRDELEFERRARAGERLPKVPADDAMAEPGDNWPATTLRVPADRAAGHVAPLLSQTKLAPDMPQDAPVEMPEVGGPAPSPDAYAESAGTLPQPVSSATTGYRIGFGLALFGCVMLLLLYLIAPGMDDANGFGAILGDARAQIDAVRFDLRQAIFGSD